MEKICGDERWKIPNSTQNTGEHDEDEDEDEEALSLSDLPLINQSAEEEEGLIIPPRQNQAQDDFDFCNFSKESEMCAADEVFYQGQILPLRHSVSSISISRSESMDHYCSGRLISSRSSSISSHQSSTSGSSSANYRPKLPPRNQFHSHPSPSPRLFKQGTNTNTISSNHRNSVSKSSVWNILRLGLVATPPEIAFQDLKVRCPSTNFGSRNSTSSNCSSAGSAKKKKKSKALIGGCRCSSDAVDTKIAIIRRSASESEAELRQGKAEKTKKQAAKKLVSHRRTFEWLKQLSVEGNADEA